VTLVVDASLVVAGLTDSGADGRRAEALLAGDSLAAPHLVVARPLTLEGYPTFRTGNSAVRFTMTTPPHPTSMQERTHLSSTAQDRTRGPRDRP
jgi:hypothetical protein